MNSKLRKCIVCKECYFKNLDALSRHQQICLAINSFVITRGLHPQENFPSSSCDSGDEVTERSRHRKRSPSVLPPNSVAVTPHRKRKSPMRLCPAKRVKKSASALNTKWPAVSLPSSASGSGVALIASSVPSTQTAPPPVPFTSRAESTPSAAIPSTSNQALPPASRAEPTHSGPALSYSLKQSLKSVKDYTIANPDFLYEDNSVFLEACVPLIGHLLETELKVAKSIKFNLVLISLYNHPSESPDEFNFKTTNSILYNHNDEDLHDIIRRDIGKLLQETDEFTGKNSGWSLMYPVHVILKVNHFAHKNLAGTSYIELPRKLQKRMACINVKNNDNMCFKYAMLAKYLPQSAGSEPTESNFNGLENIYNFDSLTYPMTVSQIRKFENRNPHCSVNVYESNSKGEIFPFRVVEPKSDHTDLLILKSENHVNGHFIYVSDFSKLIRPQICKGTNQITICKRCWSFKETRRCKPDANSWLEEHHRLCKNYAPTTVHMPKEGVNNIIKFEEFERQIKVPVIVIADFESCLVPTVSTNRTIQKHEVNSFCTLVKTTLPESVIAEAGISTVPYVHRSPDAGREFMVHMTGLAQQIEKLYSRQLPMAELTPQERERHLQANLCELCGTSFNDQTVIKCADHDHITGLFRKTLCSRCNQRAQKINYVPVYFHGLSNYDQNYVLKHLGDLPKCEVDVIPSSSEKYISISVKIGQVKLRFVDSYRLMSSSLAELASILSDDDFIESSKLVPENLKHLIKRKNVYPYDFVKNFEVFDLPGLPPQSEFYNALNDEHVKDEDFEFATEVFEKLNMSTFGQYHDFYLKLDVCLLADILTSFRETCLETYKIDCCHYYTAPAFAYAAMLRHTRVNIELMTDPDMLLMVESSVRGGLCQCCLRHAKANNPHLNRSDDYNRNEEQSYLLYLDCVNLYGLGMTFNMPMGNFKWVENVSNLDWSTLPLDSPHGYLMECDVEYPDEVHTTLQDLPPLPLMSKPPGSRTEKLLATLENKTKYIAHHLVFQQCTELGLKVTKIHRAISFTQTPFLKKFVEFNAKQRANTTNEFYKQLYKGMSNTCFGRFIMRKRDQSDVKIVTTERAFQKLVRQPRFSDRVIISDKVVAVHLRKKTIVMNSPLQVGMTILDLSKYHMYNFYYNILTRHLTSMNCQLNLCYIDTDGIIVLIKTERDLHEVLKSPDIAVILDQSTYPEGHPLRNDANKARMGCFKNEAKKGQEIQEYCGLRAKMYAYRYSSCEDDAKLAILKAKGIKKAYVRSNIVFDDYKNTLFPTEECGNPPVAEFNIIRAKSFNITTMAVVKKTLSASDDKRQILECGVRTLPYGHFKLREIAKE